MHTFQVEALRHLLRLLLVLLRSVVGEGLRAGGHTSFSSTRATSSSSSASVTRVVARPAVQAGLDLPLCSASAPASLRVLGVRARVEVGVRGRWLATLARVGTGLLTSLQGTRYLTTLGALWHLTLLWPLEEVPASLLVLHATLGHPVPPLLGAYLHNLFL
jgi:hypothetical protein